MSVALENIFDDPIHDEQPSTPHAGRELVPIQQDSDDDDNFTRPGKRRRSALFLDEEEEEEEEARSKGSSRRDVTVIPDVDSLFEDLSDPGPSSTSRTFNLDSLRREARERIDREAPSSSLPQYAVQSSSPSRDDLAGTGGKTSGIGKGESELSKKRVLPKMDTERLVDKNGFPALLQLSKEFKPKGKGHELADLNRLFTVYQFWVHKLYPRTQFIDTVNRIEKLCHSKRMHARLSVWRDEAHGTLHGMELDDNDKDAELSSEDDKQKDNEDVFGPLRVNPTSSSSRAPSEAPPASSDSEQDMAALTAIDKDDLFDIDALLAEEEEMMTGRANAAGSRVASSNSNNNKQSKLPGAVVMKGGKDDDFMFDEEEEAIWAEMHGINDDPSVAQRQSSVVNANKSKPNSESMYDDDDAWDVLNEIERESKGSSLVLGSSKIKQGPCKEPRILR